MAVKNVQKSENSVGARGQRNFAAACNFPLHFSLQLGFPHPHTHTCVWNGT